jgi:hypothetical protein
MSKARNLSDFISDPAIDSTEIGTSAITTDKISDQAVTPAKMHNTLDLSSKTVTLPTDGISGNSIHGGVISSFASTGIDDNASSTAVTIDSSGNVGIGTNDPQQLLHIHNSSGDFSAEAVLTGRLSTGTPKAEVAFKRGTSGDGAMLVLRSSNSSGSLMDSVTIKDGTGNVGIGTSNPAHKLHVVDTSAGNGTGFGYIGSWGIIGNGYDGNVLTKLNWAGGTPGSRIQGYEGTTQKYEVSANSSTWFNGGNVGIGTASPASKLQISGGTTDSYADGIAMSKSGGNLYGIYPSLNNLEFRSVTGNTHIMTMTYGGNVGIGTDNPASKLDVIGDVNISGMLKSENRHIASRPNGGGETGPQLGSRNWMWRLASDRTGVTFNYPHGNGNLYGMYFFSGTNKLQYDISLNNATYLYMKAIYHNNADSSARTGVIEWNESGAWNTLDAVTFTSSGGTVCDGTINFGTPYGRYIKARFGFSSNGSNSILIGALHIEFKTDGELRFHKCLG